VGFLAMSSKVFFGSKITPVRREKAPMLAGSGAIPGIASGVISVRWIVLQFLTLGYYEKFMRIRDGLVVLPFLLVLSGCKPSEEGHTRAIIGAVLIDGAGGPPLADSVVIVAGDRIVEVGLRTAVDIPADCDKIDGYGKYLLPALIDMYKGPDLKSTFTAPGGGPQGALQPATPDQARQQVDGLAAHKPEAIHVWIDKMQRPIAGAILEAARSAEIPITGHAFTQADARFLVDGGASRLVGMVRNTEDLNDVFVTRLRDLQIVVAPALSALPASEVARHNTRVLFLAGVPLAVASSGGDLVHEAELLVDAGVPPLDVIVAATRGGGIQRGKRADLLLLSANPGQDIRNLRKAVKLW
jgi:imidazolonepropionase-like amidohydrolase